MPYKEKTLPDVRASYSKFVLPKNAGSSNYIDHSKLPDKSLWEAFKSGDEFAFINIYKEYSNKLYNYGCQFCEDKEMVKDCLQDFFIYLRKNRLGFAETNSIKLYLFKAFKRRVVDYLNKNTSELRLSKMFAFTQFATELSCECIYINKQTKEEQLEKLNKALEALDCKEREAIYYFYYEGLSYEQIAEIFNFSHVSSARRVMYRGLRHLRYFLGTYISVAN